MENTFEQYMLNWWEEFLEDHEEEQKRLMETFIGEEETVEDYLEDGETPLEWLSAKRDANEIYKHFFGYESEQLYFDDLPETQQFLNDMFSDVCGEDYDFVVELIKDMAYHAEGYSTPIGFFQDLSHGGCVSGMIGMFIYHSDCKKFYVDHIDSMEEFVEDMEEALGEPIRNRDKQPHYTFVCWLCYEELASRIARVLYPENF